MQPTHLPYAVHGVDDPVHGLDGPDYVSLVIEWEDDDEVTMVSEPARRITAPRPTLATVLGALGAIAFATWGLHRLHAR